MLVGRNADGNDEIPLISPTSHGALRAAGREVIAALKEVSVLKTPSGPGTAVSGLSAAIYD